MGWTFTPGSTRKDIINDCIRGWDLHAGPSAGSEDNLDAYVIVGRNETLKWCTVGNVLWSVCEQRFTAGPKAGKVDRWIRCDLLQNGGERDGWGVKSMEESCGPYYYSCPLSYLDMVPCPDNESAREWREEVRKVAGVKKSRANLAATLKDGDTVFILGHEDPFIFTKRDRRKYIAQGYHLYTMPVSRIDVQRTLKALEPDEVPLGV